MGNPSSGCAPAQSPMTHPEGSSRHRQSLSISSLPLDKLGSINCEKRTSVSALSSPARGAPKSPLKVALTDNEKLSIATFLGNDHTKHQDFTRRKEPSGAEELYLKGMELASDDRETMGSSLFRGSQHDDHADEHDVISGHRRVGSGSYTTPCKSASEYSPRAKSGSTSKPSTPKKLDMYAVAKIAASLFHSPTKLERSMSLSRASHRSIPEVVKKGNPGHSLAVGEVILPANLEVPPFLHQDSQFIQSVNVVDGGNRSSSSDSDSAMDMEEAASPQTSNSTSVQRNIVDITEMLEGENDAEQPAIVAMEEPPATIEDIAPGLLSLHSRVSLNAADTDMHIIDKEDSSHDDVVSSPSSSQSSCMTSTETSIQSHSTGSSSPLEAHELGHDFLESVAALFEDAAVEEESNDIAVDDNLQFLLLATEEATDDTRLIDTAVRCSLPSENDDPTDALTTDSEDETLSIPSTGSSEERGMNIQVPEMKATVRKRRRSVSASGIGAMLLKMVRVSDSVQIVTRRTSKVESPAAMLLPQEALRARKYVLEKTTQIPLGSAHEESASISSFRSISGHVCQIEAEDAIKATYSKFVDIEIDPGGDCIELVQNSKDEQDGAASPFESRQRSRQATPGTSPRHLHDQESNNCAVHQGIPNDKFDTQTKSSTLTSSNAQTADDRHGRATIGSPDLHSLKGCLKTMKTAERSRTVVFSRLQAPNSEAFSRVDIYRPCSTVSILANSSFSSSHQDKLWEEQAEIYSSGGRGTPSRDDDAAATPNVIINLRKSPLLAPCASGSHEAYPGWRQAAVLESSGKKRGWANTPTRIFLDDHGRRTSPESGHFIQQIMSRIRGSTPPKPSPFPMSTSSHLAMEKRRNSWSSCICFSVK